MEKNLVSRDPEIMSGALVFTGTRVLVKSLFDYIEAGDPLNEFLDNFPTVSREHAVSVLEVALNNLGSKTMSSTVRTCLWFRDGRGREAAQFYCSLIPESRIERTFSGDAGNGTFSVIDFSLGAARYQILDAGPIFTLTEAVSISVETADQAETDRLWFALTSNGGIESVCGWLKDRYGVSWQIFPKRLTELTLSTDKHVSANAMAAMMKQKKIEISAIEAAVRDE